MKLWAEARATSQNPLPGLVAASVTEAVLVVKLIRLQKQIANSVRILGSG